MKTFCPLKKKIKNWINKFKNQLSSATNIDTDEDLNQDLFKIISTKKGTKMLMPFLKE
jgi:hypothetical protein